MKYLKAKRVIDLVLSVLAAVILSPVFLILFIAIKLDTPGPIFFKQKRVGINKTHFNILKFRTMRIDTPKDTPTHLLGNPDQYITKVGKFLRKTSLDELPQIWNVLIGQMSLVGPRPIVDAEIEKYSEYISDYYLVPPGITGMWQVNGRSDVTFENRLIMDCWYIGNWSFWLDLVLLLKTIGIVLDKKGAK